MNNLYSLLITICFSLIFSPLYSQDVAGDEEFIPEFVKYHLILHTDSGNFDQVKDFLEFGVDPNISTYDGVTPLMFAAQNGFYKIAKLLIDYNADVNAYPYDGNTALHAAVRSNNDSIAELLLDNNADVNIKNSQGISSLHYAAAFGYPFLTRLLIYFGANIDEEDNYGNTPLTAAVYSGAQMITEILLENGADANHSDSKGYTPIMIAAQYNDTSLMNLLIDYRADVLKRNKDGTTALALAIRYNALNAVELLIANGAASQDFSNSKGYIQLARENNVTKIIPILEVQGLKRSTKPAITSVNLNTGFRFSENDFFFDFGAGIIESLTQTLIGFNYSYRPYKKVVLVERENEYFQFWERRRIIGISIDKLINVKRLPNGNFIGLNLGIAGNYTWGNYTYPDARSKPDDLYYFSPRAGLFYNGKYIFLGSSVEYVTKRIEETKPLFFSLLCGFKFNTDRTKIKPKRIYWIN